MRKYNEYGWVEPFAENAREVAEERGCELNPYDRYVLLLNLIYDERGTLDHDEHADIVEDWVPWCGRDMASRLFERAKQDGRVPSDLMEFSLATFM